MYLKFRKLEGRLLSERVMKMKAFEEASSRSPLRKCGILVGHVCLFEFAEGIMSAKEPVSIVNSRNWEVQSLFCDLSIHLIHSTSGSFNE